MLKKFFGNKDDNQDKGRSEAPAAGPRKIVIKSKKTFEERKQEVKERAEINPSPVSTAEPFKPVGSQQITQDTASPAELTEANETIAYLKEEIEALKLSIAELENDLSQTEPLSASEETELIQKLQGELAEANQTIETFQSSSVEAGNSEAHDIADSSEDESQTQGQLEEADRKIVELQQTIETLRSQNSDALDESSGPVLQSGQEEELQTQLEKRNGEVSELQDLLAKGPILCPSSGTRIFLCSR